MLQKCLLGVLTIASFLAAPVQASPVTVDSVEARVEDQVGVLPPLVQKRMQASVETIAEQLMSGRRVDQLQAEELQNEKIIREVFDKLLVGYTVTAVDIEPAVRTKVLVRLQPWAETIRSVAVTVEAEGLNPEIKALALQDTANIAAVFEQVLCGLPVDATDWSNGVLKQSINAYMALHLPEFWADFELDPGTESRVRLQLYPKGPVVRNVDLSMRSDTIPNMLLLNYRPQLQRRADMMLGLPIAFVERHKEYFRRAFSDTLGREPDFQKLRMRTVVELVPGARTAVMSRSDSTKYRLRVEGRLDMGRNGGNEEESTSFHVHVGDFISAKDEIFGQLDFYPQEVETSWYAGYGRMLGRDTEVFLKYDLGDAGFTWGIGREFNRFWHLRYEYDEDDRRGEVGLRYKLHDFVSLEYVLNRDDSWLRLIGNF